MSELSPVSRSNLRQGAVYLLVGLLWGMVIPASPFPRLALGAHLQLTTSGVMFLVAGLVILHLPFAKGSVSAKILMAGPWLTWPVMLTEMANGWWGARKTLHIAAAQAGASGAEPRVTGRVFRWEKGIGTRNRIRESMQCSGTVRTCRSTNINQTNLAFELNNRQMARGETDAANATFLRPRSQLRGSN